MAYRGAAVALVAALLLGCGHGRDRVDVAADRADSTRTIADFERRARAAGFAADEGNGSDDQGLTFTSAGCQHLQEAFGDTDALPGETASAESAALSRGQADLEGGAGHTVAASVGVVRDADELARVFALLDDEHLDRCVHDAIERELTEQVAGEDVRLDSLAVRAVDLASVGDQATSLRVDGTLVTAGVRVPFAFDVSLGREGRGAAFLIASTVGGTAVSYPVADELGRLLASLT